MIYLDYNATAPMRAEALDALETMSRDARNATSIHGPGRRARVALDGARESIRVLVGAPKMDVVFTGSGTEADLLGLMGLARRERRARGAQRVLISAIEHPAVAEAAHQLSREGFVIEQIPFARPSGIDFEALESMLGPDVAVVGVMLANNETGLIMPVARVSRLAGALGVPVHCDAVQAAGKMPVSFVELGVTTMAIAGHKFGGPRGVGALITLKCAALPPLWAGGGQEEGMRSGSHATGLAVAMGEAAKTSLAWLEGGGVTALAGLRDSIEDGFEREVDAQILCRGFERLPNTALIGLSGWTGKELVERLDDAGVMVSAGAACHAQSSGPSSTAMLFDSTETMGVMRLSLGPQSTESDVTRAVSLARQALVGGVAQ